MKKTVTIFLFFTVFLFCACQKQETGNENTGSSPSIVSGSDAASVCDNRGDESTDAAVRKAASYYIKGKTAFTGTEVKKLKKWLDKHSRYLDAETLQPGQSLYAVSLYDDTGKKKNTEKNYYSADLIQYYTKDYAEGTLSFGKDGISDSQNSKELALSFRKLLTGITEGKVSKAYDRIVVSDENYKKADKNYVREMKKGREQEGVVMYERTAPSYEYYEDTFYQEIDGIRCMNMGVSMVVKERDRVADADKKEADGCLAKNQDKWELYSQNTGHVTLRYHAAGVDMFEADAWLIPGREYKKAAPVKTEEEIRKNVEEQLQQAGKGQKEKSGIEGKRTKMTGAGSSRSGSMIESVELVYCPYFSIENGKKIRDVLAPFWVVRAYPDGVRRQFFYDAYTGVLVQKF